jgi:hypothetical protein
MRFSLTLAIAAIVSMSAIGEARPISPTVAESSHFSRTGRYDEVLRWCDELPRAYPGKVKCLTFGTTPEGRKMIALVAGGKDKPVVYFQGGVHAGEIDGKDAGYQVLRELLEGKSPALEKLTVIFVPVYNVDGHERFGANHRPNQVGPEESGWRTTAQNFNLNRDAMKAEAPETAAQLGLLDAWDPILFIDLHVTDGADFQPDVAVLVEPRLHGPPALTAAGSELARLLGERLTAMGHLPVTDFYPSFVKESDPMSGFNAYLPSPRFTSSYWATRNRLSILVETHSWKDYATRVRATHDLLVAAIDQAAQNGAKWRELARAADQSDRAIAGAPVELAWTETGHARTIPFRGWAYTRTPSTASGGLRTRYDPKTSQIWNVPFFDEIKPSLIVGAPRGGYLIPPAWAPLLREKMKLHQIEFSTVKGRSSLPVSVYRATEVSFAKAPFEGRTRVASLKGAWIRDTRAIPDGALFVPIAQPRARLAMQLLEPEAPDSLLAWGFFNLCFEQKEFMEPYVAEAVAEEMLKDPSVKAEFERRLASDKAFAADPEKRLDWFYRRHPAWDERVNLYPIFRTDELLTR